jgi:hypothetical protein
MKYAVVFIHGLARKPPKDDLHDIWRWALSQDNPRTDVFGTGNSSVFTRATVNTALCYYANFFHGTNFETDLDSYFKLNDDSTQWHELNSSGNNGLEGIVENEPEHSLEATAFQEKLVAKLRLQSTVESGTDTEALGLLPPFLREQLIKKFAMEAYYYLYDKPYTLDGTTQKIKTKIQDALIFELKKLSETADKLVLVAHSLGSIIAYDVLRNRSDCPPVDRLITMGSPLGISEVQDKLFAPENDEVDFPSERVGEWVNIYDPLDPICGLDPKLANEYLKNGNEVVKDVREDNWGEWRHTVTHYLCGKKMRDALIY